MKKFLPGLICLAGTACLYCCSSEYDIFENDVEQISDQFSVAEARAYFERTAEDLRGVTIGAGHTHAPVTKALPAPTKSRAAGVDSSVVERAADRR